MGVHFSHWRTCSMASNLQLGSMGALVHLIVEGCQDNGGLRVYKSILISDHKSSGPSINCCCLPIFLHMVI
ncbi:hypothetical protein XELAEV_18022285mg [Xenopus laevis]|uniref:Uncharacterized protein n=1 Tax=Xenopus laevis TaxID=8355 RepID=A0A974D3Z7_XENLA|nr:hypothetical protein XELAEV_18022285mg [Xenopus laevis]